MVRVLAGGPAELGCCSDPRPGRGHHYSGVAVVRAALSPSLLSHLPQ